MDVEFQNGKILHGDVLDRLKDIPDESVDCEITSFPYWGLRDYGVEGQIGLESNFRDYLEILYRIMDELKRVLKSTGTCWINLGDCYGSHRSNEDSKMVADKQEKQPIKGYDKSRMGIPERFYIHCIDDGWIARNHIPWYKANAMPSSIKDRFTNKWESIFFFAKEKKYYFDLDAVRISPLTDSKPFNIRVRENITGRAQMKLGDQAWTATEEEMKKYNRSGIRKQDNVVMGNGRIDPTKEGFNKRYGEGKWQRHYDPDGNCFGCGKHYTKHQVTNRAQGSENRDERQKDDYVWCNPRGKNPGDVFFINPRPFPDAHFATFPPELPEKILKCACPAQVCNHCGKPRNPISKATPEYQKILDLKPASNVDSMKKYSGLSCDKLSNNCLVASYQIVGWTDCGCNVGFKGGTVLDPFFGSGTVGLVAEQLNRKWIGIELSEEYIKICKKRLLPYNSVRLDEFV